MISITMTAKQQDDRIKVSYNGTAPTGTYISGHLFLDKDEYGSLTFDDMRKKVYEKIVNDFKGDE